MKTNILVIQFRQNEIACRKEAESISREVGEWAEVTYVNALDTSTNWTVPEMILNKHDGVILGGSGELYFSLADQQAVGNSSYELLERLRPLFQYIFDNDIPTLGICYGHQILGAFAGAQVIHDEAQVKTGSHQVQVLTHDHFLFMDVPCAFAAQYAHKNVLDRVPPSTVLIMTGGEACRVPALRYRENICSVQFHPELTRADALERAARNPSYFPAGVAIEDLYAETPHATKLLQNFAIFITRRSGDPAISTTGKTAATVES